MKPLDTIEEIGRLTAKLKRHQLAPSIVHTATAGNSGPVHYATIIKLQSGFSRITLEAGGKSTNSPEEAYLFALRNFWIGLTQEVENAK